MKEINIICILRMKWGIIELIPNIKYTIIFKAIPLMTSPYPTGGWPSFQLLDHNMMIEFQALETEVGLWRT